MIRLAFVCILGLGLSAGCVSTDTRLPDIDRAALNQERILQEQAAFSVMKGKLIHFHDIGFQILKANRALCPKTRPDFGLIIRQTSDYPKEMREAARRELGLGETPSVLWVRPGSGADQAGIQPGDRLQTLDGLPVTSKSGAMAEILWQQGQVMIQRGDKQIGLVDIKPEMVCGYQLALKMSPTINAYANGRKITMTAGMMDFVASDDELAMIIGHELAHNSQGHVRKMISNYILSGFAQRYVRPFEAEADYLGLYHMVRAGFDPNKVEAFWRRLALLSPRYIDKDKIHPAYAERAAQIAAVRAQIKAKIARGEALLPDYKAEDGS